MEGVKPAPGDVVVVQLGGLGGWLIRVGARIKGLPAHSSHVAIVSDVNEVIEAWPGGVRTNSLASYVATKWTVTNAAESKSDAQRAAIVALAKSFLKTPYDWAAIAEDTTNALNIEDPMIRDWSVSSPPKHVVCSSLADYIYQKVGLISPVGSRFVSPADWAKVIFDHGWDSY